MQQEYELVLVMRADRSESEKKSLLEAIEKDIETDKGEVLNVDAWGKKQLAYEIDKNSYGDYTLVTFKSSPKTPQKINSKLVINEDLLRFLIVKRGRDHTESKGKGRANKKN